MPRGWLSGDAPALQLDLATGEFRVDPKKFSEEVIRRIDSDFSTFEGAGSANHPIPQVVSTFNGTTSGPLPFSPPATGVL